VPRERSLQGSTVQGSLLEFVFPLEQQQKHGTVLISELWIGNVFQSRTKIWNEEHQLKPFRSKYYTINDTSAGTHPSLFPNCKQLMWHQFCSVYGSAHLITPKPWHCTLIFIHSCRTLHIKEDERHGRWMLQDVAEPLVDM